MSKYEWKKEKKRGTFDVNVKDPKCIAPASI